MVSSLITSVRGTLEGIGPDWADVTVGGVTFRLSIPSPAVERLGKTGDQVHLVTSLQVREDSLTLFGFLTEDDRRAFDYLIGVNGVGPRVALSVLSRFTPATLAAAVTSGDTDSFAGVPGVGKKTASRIVLELKGKLEGDWAIPLEIVADSEVIEALVSLGYSQTEARDAVMALPPATGESTEERLRQALQRMGGP